MRARMGVAALVVAVVAAGCGSGATKTVTAATPTSSTATTGVSSQETTAAAPTTTAEIRRSPVVSPNQILRVFFTDPANDVAPGSFDIIRGSIRIFGRGHTIVSITTRSSLRRADVYEGAWITTKSGNHVWNIHYERDGGENTFAWSSAKGVQKPCVGDFPESNTVTLVCTVSGLSSARKNLGGLLVSEIGVTDLINDYAPDATKLFGSVKPFRIMRTS